MNATRARSTPAWLLTERGATLAVVLWALVALSFAALNAAASARLELALARGYRDHAVALAWAESGLADALAVAARLGSPAGDAGALSRAGEDGAVTTIWAPAGAGLRFRASGASRTARRTVEAWVSRDAAGALRVTDWKEVLGQEE